jgi:hypothetical protein
MTTCSQSQIEQDRYLLLQRTGQGEAASVLSVGVRWRPVRTAVNGMLVARPRLDPGRPERHPERSAMVQGWVTSPDTLTGAPGGCPAGQVGDPQPSRDRCDAGRKWTAMGVACRLRGPCGVRLDVGMRGWDR